MPPTLPACSMTPCALSCLSVCDAMTPNTSCGWSTSALGARASRRKSLSALPCRALRDDATARRPITVIIRPSHEETGVRRHGCFAVYYDDWKICCSWDPIRDAGCAFFYLGMPPETLLIVRHASGNRIAATTEIGAAIYGVRFMGKNIVCFGDAVAERRARDEAAACRAAPGSGAEERLDGRSAEVQRKRPPLRDRVLG